MSFLHLFRKHIVPRKRVSRLEGVVLHQVQVPNYGWVTLSQEVFKKGK